MEGPEVVDGCPKMPAPAEGPEEVAGFPWPKNENPEEVVGVAF